MVANLNTLVQKIVVQADLSGVNKLSNALGRLNGAAKRVKAAFEASTPIKERIELQKLANVYAATIASMSNYAQKRMTIRSKEVTERKRLQKEIEKEKHLVTENEIALKKLDVQRQMHMEITKRQAQFETTRREQERQTTEMLKRKTEAERQTTEMLKRKTEAERQATEAAKKENLEKRKGIALTNESSAQKRLETQLSRERIAELRKETAERRNATNAIKTQSSAMLGLKSLLGYFVGIHTVFSFVRDAREIDLMQRSIQGLTKTTQDWEYIKQQAFRTGTNIKDTARGYRNFYASASMAGFGKGSIQGMYADLLTVTRSIGATPIQTQGALLALEQMISKGVVSMEELRRQLGNAVPGAFEVAAKAIGMTTQELNEMVKSGKLYSVEFVPAFIKALKGEFGGGFVEATKSMDFALRNLKNSWLIFVDSITKGDVGKSFTQSINALSALITDPDFLYTIQLVGKVLGLIFTFARKAINFTRKHLPLILGLLGMAGLAGGLLTIKNLMIAVAGLLVTIQQYAFATGLTLNATFGKVLLANIKSFALGVKSALTPLIAMHAWLLGIIALIVVWQDLWVSVFGDKNRPTMGRYLAAKKQRELGEGKSKARSASALSGAIFGGILGGITTGGWGVPIGIAAGAGGSYGIERLGENATALLQLEPRMATYTSPTAALERYYNSAGSFNLNKDQSVSINNVNIYESQNGITTYQNIIDSFGNVCGVE